jgi:predicted oxidoreductase
VLDWTRGLGVHWLPATDPSGLGTRLLQPEGGGAALTARMADRVAEAGVAIRLDLRADGLTRTDGWQVALADGSVLDSDAVVVATGGFMGSLQRARDTLGLPDLLVSAPAFVDGAGEDWLIAAGGTVPASRAAIVYGHAVRHPLDPTLALMVVDAPRGVIVDDAGRMMRAPLTPRGGIEPGQGPRYLVVDSAGLDQLKFFDPLSDTLYDARGVIRAGGWLAPDGSMAAIELMETGAKSLTGVNTDTDGRVLDLSRNPIPGLFAAGEVAGFGHASHPPVDNTMIASAILSGRAAGKAAARAR